MVGDEIEAMLEEVAKAGKVGGHAGWEARRGAKSRCRRLTIRSDAA
jgi:hypothetical protein